MDALLSGTAREFRLIYETFLSHHESMIVSLYTPVVWSPLLKVLREKSVFEHSPEAVVVDGTSRMT